MSGCSGGGSIWERVGRVTARLHHRSYAVHEYIFAHPSAGSGQEPGSRFDGDPPRVAVTRTGLWRLLRVTFF